MSKSNIQSLDHIDHSKTAHAIKNLKHEIKYGVEKKVNEEEQNRNDVLNFCKNEVTGKMYSFIIGSREERDLFRVMPLDGSKKIYFNSIDEYNTWFRIKHKSRNNFYIKSINGAHF